MTGKGCFGNDKILPEYIFDQILSASSLGCPLTFNSIYGVVSWTESTG